jgi:hypothetical protein
LWVIRSSVAAHVIKRFANRLSQNFLPPLSTLKRRVLSTGNLWFATKAVKQGDPSRAVRREPIDQLAAR